MPDNKMSKSDSQRIQSAQAKGGHDMGSGGFAARAQSAADRHAHHQASSNSGKPSDGNNGSSAGGRSK